MVVERSSPLVWHTLLPTAVVAVGLLFLYTAWQLGRLRVGSTPFHRLTWCNSLLLLLFFGLLATWHGGRAWRQVTRAWPRQPQPFAAVLLTAPTGTDYGAVAQAWCRVPGRAPVVLQLTLQDTCAARALQAGDELWVHARIALPVNRGNPCEFDRETYLAARGVSGQARVEHDRWRRLRAFDWHHSPLPLWRRMAVVAMRCRAQLVQVYRQLGLTDHTLALVSALTLGERSSLSRQVRQDFADAGVSHLLALSGMHLSYVVGFCHFLLTLLPGWRRWRSVGTVALLLFTWLYVWVAGAPVSLVRAALMYSLMMAGTLMHRDGFSLNSLAMSALLLVAVSPLLVFDVGFQLSFLAMVGILLAAPLRPAPSASRLRRALAGALLMAVGAQLLTAPWVALRFGTLPLLSLPLSFLATPLVALLVCAAPLLLLGAWIGLPLSWAVSAFDGVVWLLRTLLGTCALWPLATCAVDPSMAAVLLFYLFLFTLWLYHSLPLSLWLRTVSCTLLLWVGVVSVGLWRARNTHMVVFYYAPRCPAVHVVCGASLSYLFPVPGGQPQALQGIRNTFWHRRLSAPPQVMAPVPAAVGAPAVVRCAGFTFLSLADDAWQFWRQATPLDVDYLHLCGGFGGSLSQLLPQVRPACVVLDASLPYHQCERLHAECVALGCTVHDMRQQGALCKVLGR